MSSATVSRVLGGRVSVATETRARVLRSVQRLGYTPNAMARGLRSGRGRAVALVTGDIEQGVYAALAKHVQAAMEPIGLDLVLFNLGHREDRLRRLIESAPSLGLRGVLLASPHVMDMAELSPLFEAAAATGVAFISLSQDLSPVGILSIVHDDAGGARAAVAHLLRAGRGPVAFLGRIATSAVGRERYNGYRQAVQATGRAPEPALVWDIAEGYRADAGHGAVSRALVAGQAFSAVFAASDELALGAMAAVTDHGLSIPADVAIVGFGGLEWGRYTRPAITTVALDVEAIGMAVGQAFRVIDERGMPPDRLVVATSLLVRGSA